MPGMALVHQCFCVPGKKRGQASILTASFEMLIDRRMTRAARAALPGYVSQPVIPLADWRLPIPADWLKLVNRPETEAELTALRQSVNRGAPFGNPDWQEQIAQR